MLRLFLRNRSMGIASHVYIENYVSFNKKYKYFSEHTRIMFAKDSDTHVCVDDSKKNRHVCSNVVATRRRSRQICYTCNRNLSFSQKEITNQI